MPINYSPPSRPIDDVHFFQDESYMALRPQGRWQTRLHVFKDSTTSLPIGQAILMRRRLRILPYDVLMVLFGPKVNFADDAAVRSVFKELAELARASGAIYLAVQPYVTKDQRLPQILQEQGYVSSNKHILYRHTGLVDLSRSGEEIYAGFKDTVRSSIRRAERDQVEIHVNTNAEMVEKYYDLYKQSYERGGGGYQSLDYFKKVWQELAVKHEVLFVLVTVKGVIASGALMGLIGGNMVYLCGGTSTDKQLMASQPNEKMHWELIQLAKQWGCRFYDMGGINPSPAAGSKSAGISNFKLKFCQVYDLLGFYRYDCRPFLAKGLDTVVPLLTRWRYRLGGAQETDYNLL